MNEASFINAIQRILKPIKDKLLLLATRGLIVSTDDTKGIQTVQMKGLADETMNNVPVYQHFGFSSRPPKNTQAIVINIGANRDNCVIIATDHGEIRFKNLGEGESAVYTDDGTYIHLKKAGQVEVKAATKLTVDVPDSEFKGNIKVTGNMEIVGTSKQTGAVTHEATLTVQGATTMQAVQAQAIQAASLAAAGAITGAGGTIALSDIKSKFNSHTHAENGTGGGVTNTPNVTI